jgi:transcriptional regulator with XRE-family HTH domain
MVGKAIKRLRLAREMTKSELARRVRVSPTAVNNWEENGTNPRPEMLGAIAAALNTTVASLTGMPPSSPDTGKPTPADAAAVVQEAKQKIAEAYGISGNKVEVLIRF